VVVAASSAAFAQTVTVSQIVCTPSNLNSGASTTCTAELSGPAPAGGTQVSLSSNNTLLPLSAASVTVPAGATSTTFTATAGSISSSQSATITATALYSVSLTWTSSTSAGITSYNLYRGTATGGPYTLETSLGLVTTYTDYNVQDNQAYYYVTTAVDSGEESAYSNQASAVLPSAVSQTATISLVPLGPVITSATSASGTVGSAFSYQIAASNSPTSYAATGLPAGLSVNTTTGLISGTPTAGGTSTVTLSATNSGGTGSAKLTLTISVLAPVITSAASASGTVGSAFSYQIAASNSPTSYAATGLPAGLSVSTTTGLISGTPTAGGTSTVTLSATNSGGTGSAKLTLTISEHHRDR
jgi:fibronectin type 3 domain-containing protein